jgi:hypothetical protein
MLRRAPTCLWEAVSVVVPNGQHLVFSPLYCARPKDLLLTQRTWQKKWLVAADILFFVFIYLFSAGKPRGLYMLGKCSPIELQPPTLDAFFFFNVNSTKLKDGLISW